MLTSEPSHHREDPRYARTSSPRGKREDAAAPCQVRLPLPAGRRPAEGWGEGGTHGWDFGALPTGVAMIFGPFERMVAGRYLRARRQEGFVSVIVGFSFLGIALGVATLIIVMAVMNGFREDILSRILGVNDHIDVTSPVALTDFDALAGKIKLVNGVVDVTPVVESQAMITTDRYAGGALVRGVRGEDLKAKPWIADHILEGSLDTFMKGDGILIGSRMAERYGVHVGGELTVISPRGIVTAFGTVPREHAFPIVGIFNVGETDFDSGMVFMPLELGPEVLPLRGRRHGP